MRKIQNIISIFTLTILCLSSVGCSKGCFANEHKWLYEKMSEIPIEYEEYYFENIYGTEEDESAVSQNTIKEYIFRGKTLTVDEYTIIYDENKIVIDINFIEQRSQVSSYINHIWDENGKIRTHQPWISGIQVFDDKIFLSTCGIETQMAGTARGVTPFVLYYYDIDNDKILSIRSYFTNIRCLFCKSVTFPMMAQGRDRVESLWIAVWASAGSMLRRRPPEVCGSKTRSSRAASSDRASAVCSPESSGRNSDSLLSRFFHANSHSVPANSRLRYAPAGISPIDA